MTWRKSGADRIMMHSYREQSFIGHEETLTFDTAPYISSISQHLTGINENSLKRG